jgi:hypothetical protein
MPRVKVYLPDDVSGKVWKAQGSMSNVKSTNKGIEVTFPQGGYKARDGANLKCALDDVFPSKDITLLYRVYVPHDFDFALAGKLPGLTINEGTGGRAWQKDAASVRGMWRRGGQVVGYLYLCTDVGHYNGTENCALMREQSKAFARNAHHTNGAGIDMFRFGKTPLTLKRGEWNRIKIRCKLNDPGKANGKLSIRVNKNKKVVKGMMYTADPEKNQFEQMQLSTWFGGGSKKYASPKTQSLTFKKFKLVSRVKKLLPFKLIKTRT